MKESRLLQLLQERNWSISTAESCTGGLVAGLLCDISGISAYFEEGYITYSESAKIRNLDVSEQTLLEHGVVSCEVAQEMAQGAARRANANCAVSTTGIAGPGGGTPENPVGTVCFAWYIDGKTYSEKGFFEGNRMEIRMQAASYALKKLCNYIEMTEKE